MHRKNILRVFLFVLAAVLAAAVAPAQSSQVIHADRIPVDDLIQPAALHRELRAHRHLLVLQVGSRMLFDEAHIPGAEYAGPASRPEGLAKLRQRVAGLPRGRAIVIYCGCCPWSHCPNIAPAWQLLHRMGFTHVKALYLADNFGADWVSQGYGEEISR